MSDNKQSQKLVDRILSRLVEIREFGLKDIKVRLDHYPNDQKYRLVVTAVVLEADNTVSVSMVLPETVVNNSARLLSPNPIVERVREMVMNAVQSYREGITSVDGIAEEYKKLKTTELQEKIDKSLWLEEYRKNNPFQLTPEEERYFSEREEWERMGMR